MIPSEIRIADLERPERANQFIQAWSAKQASELLSNSENNDDAMGHMFGDVLILCICTSVL